MYLHIYDYIYPRQYTNSTPTSPFSPVHFCAYFDYTNGLFSHFSIFSSPAQKINVQSLLSLHVNVWNGRELVDIEEENIIFFF